MLDRDDSASEDESHDFLGFCSFPRGLVGAAFGAGVSKGFSIAVQVESVHRFGGGCVGVRAGKTHMCGKSSVVFSTASPFVSCAFRW